MSIIEDKDFRHQIGIYEEEDLLKSFVIDFMLSGDNYREHFNLKIICSYDEMQDYIISNLTGPYSFNAFQNLFVIRQEDTIIKVYFDEASKSGASDFDWETDDDGVLTLVDIPKEKTDKLRFTFVLYSRNKEYIKKLKNDILKFGKERETYSIVWSFNTAHGIRKRDLFIEEQKPLTKDLYPWIPTETIQEYFKQYLESSATILLLTGVPGTGKTTFIRNMITENKLNVDLTYDDKLMSSDEYFLNFINSDDLDLMVIEDADNMLVSREENDNSVLNKILNISDGVVKTTGKKIVFSTNITDIERIDQALIRPGRCFDVLDFRQLSYDEALNVVKQQGLNKELEKRDYTLAELFSENNRKQFFSYRKVGF